MPAPRKRARVAEAHHGAEGRLEGLRRQGGRLQVAERPEGGQERAQDEPQQLGRRARRRVAPGQVRGGSARAAPESRAAHAAPRGSEPPELGGCVEAEPQPTEPRLGSSTEAAAPQVSSPCQVVGAVEVGGCHLSCMSPMYCLHGWHCRKHPVFCRVDCLSAYAHIPPADKGSEL